MSAWWNSLLLVQQVFYGVSILATLVLVVQTVLTLHGIDHATDVVSDGNVHHSGLGLLSVQAIATFFVGFGWVGVIWLNRGFGVVVAATAGVVVGSFLMAAMVIFTRWLTRLQDSGTLDYRNAVGVVGTVYCPIPPQRAVGGQVEVLIQGRTVFAEAVTEASSQLKTGAKIRVVSLLGRSTLMVEPL
jgi:hypothetical protein